MRLLITGSDGFIGNRLIKEFDDVKGVDVNKGYDITNIDTIISLGDFDCVVHLAAIANIAFSVKNPKQTYKVNVDGTKNVLEMCRKNDIRKIVFPSTAYRYGKPKYVPIDENHSVRPSSPYAKSKIMCEKLIQEYSDNYGIKYVILVLFNVFAENGNKEMVIPFIINQIKEDRNVVVKNLDSKRDFIYISDVVDAFKKAITFGENDVFNIGSGKSHSVKEIIQILIQISGKNLSFKSRNIINKDNPNEVYADISKAKSVLGWKPKVGIKEGLGLAYMNTMR